LDNVDVELVLTLVTVITAEAILQPFGGGNNMFLNVSRPMSTGKEA
jgi:hypothetical protein